MSRLGGIGYEVYSFGFRTSMKILPDDNINRGFFERQGIFEHFQ